MAYWSVAYATVIHRAMGEHFGQQGAERARIAGKRPGKQMAETIGRRLLEIVVYERCCRIGGKLTLDDLVETSEVGDWKMPDFKAGRAYAASQGWVIVEDDALTLTPAGLAAA
jgi:hypothetical protein